MEVLLIMNGAAFLNDSSSPVGGGVIRACEIARMWQRKGHDIHFFTSEAGRDLLNKLDIDVTFHIFRTSSKYFSITNNISKAWKSFFIPKSLRNFRGIIYSTTELWYDSVPAAQIKKQDKSNIWAAVAHWVAPWRRTGSSFLNSSLFHISQQVGFFYIRNYADIILAVSEPTANQLIKIGISENKVFPVECGVNYQKIREITKENGEKKYDAIFMKRFDETKGVFDIIKIWKEVLKFKRDAKLGMMGLGSEDVLIKLNKMIDEYDMKNNVEFLGQIYDFKKKFSILSKSKLFVLPTYEENWAIGIGEAMACGIPVICYDLPEIKPIWEDNLIWTPKGDKKAFADVIIQLLDDDKKRKIISERGKKFVIKYDWEKIAERELDFIMNG